MKRTIRIYDAKFKFPNEEYIKEIKTHEEEKLKNSGMKSSRKIQKMKRDKVIHSSIQVYKFLVMNLLVIWRAVLSMWMIYLYGNELFLHYQNNYEVGRSIITRIVEIDFIE